MTKCLQTCHFPSPSRRLFLYQENQRPGDPLAPGGLHDSAANVELRLSRSKRLETGETWFELNATLAK